MSGREKELQELQKQVGALIEQVDYLNRLLVLEKQKAKSIETVQELSEQLIAKRETEIQELKEQVQRITAGTLERARKDKHLIVQMREANELLSAENSLLKINIAHHADLLSQLEKAHVDLVILRDNKDRIIEILKSEVVAAKEETQDALESAEALKKLHASKEAGIKEKEQVRFNCVSQQLTLAQKEVKALKQAHQAAIGKLKRDLEEKYQSSLSARLSDIKTNHQSELESLARDKLALSHEITGLKEKIAKMKELIEQKNALSAEVLLPMLQPMMAGLAEEAAKKAADEALRVGSLRVEAKLGAQGEVLGSVLTALQGLESRFSSLSASQIAATAASAPYSTNGHYYPRPPVGYPGVHPGAYPVFHSGRMMMGVGPIVSPMVVAVRPAGASAASCYIAELPTPENAALFRGEHPASTSPSPGSLAHDDTADASC